MSGHPDGRAIVLLYHRVATPALDPQLLCVAPEHFAKHMRIIRERAHPIGMRELAEAAQHDRVPPRGVAVTFDDGYADNLHAAVPALAAANVPATVFVTTDLGQRDREFWWDELERILLEPERVPPVLTLSIGGQHLEWVMEEQALVGVSSASTSNRPQRDGGKSRNCPPIRPWHVLEKAIPTRRQAVYLDLCGRIRPLETLEREHVMAALRAWDGLGEAPRPSHLRLTDCELRVLAQSGMEVGAHTVSHPVLSRLTAEAQEREIGASRARLAEITGREIAGFSYPYGQRSDFTQQTVAIVRECGFDYACANFPGKVTAQTDLFQMPRYLVRDWPAEVFAERLEEWLHG